MRDTIDQYIKIRSYVLSSVTEKLQTFLIDKLDPLIKHVITREIYEMVNKELVEKFPDFPKHLFPQMRIKIDEEEKDITVGIQTYLNEDPSLNFLGVSDMDDATYDFYVGDCFDSRADHKLVARYGHYAHNLYEGTRTAESEYFLGMFTPLSVAYGMAIEDGFIS